jgi:hypothetical protein
MYLVSSRYLVQLLLLWIVADSIPDELQKQQQQATSVTTQRLRCPVSNCWPPGHTAAVSSFGGEDAKLVTWLHAWLRGSCTWPMAFIGACTLQPRL